MIQRWPLLLAIVVGLSALGFEWETGRERERAVQLQGRIGQLRAFAANVDSLALTVRISVIPSYDALVANLAELRRMERELAPALEPELGPEAAAFREVLAKRTELIEALKAKRSAARNTERFLVRYVESENAAPEVVRPLLAFELVPDDARAEALNKVAVTDPILARHLRLKSVGRLELDNMVLDVAREDLASSAATLEDRLNQERAAAETRDQYIRVSLLTALMLLLLVEAWRSGRVLRVDMSA